jgi:hypothetical protein
MKTTMSKQHTDIHSLNIFYSTTKHLTFDGARYLTSDQTCKGLWRKNVDSKQHDENVIGDDYLNMLYVWTYTNDHAFY